MAANGQQGLKSSSHFVVTLICMTYTFYRAIRAKRQ